MAKAKYINTSRITDNMDVNMQQDVDIPKSVNELIRDPDLLLRSFGISDDFYDDHMAELYNQSEENTKPIVQHQGVIIKNSQINNTSSTSAFSPINPPSSSSTLQLTNLQNIIMTTQPPTQQSFNT